MRKWLPPVLAVAGAAIFALAIYRDGILPTLAILFVGAALLTLPIWAGWILDPWAYATIHLYCRRRGLTDITISRHSGHYGVRATRQGARIYARCQFIFGRLRWKGEAP